MILYQNSYQWTKRMDLATVDEQGNPTPVQKWCYIWDSRCKNSSFVVFYEDFVHIILQVLGYAIPRLSTKMLQLVIPLALRSEQGHTHNFGDWFFLPKVTIIRVNGFPTAPHILPKFVPLRLTFLEFMWQMMWMEKDVMHKQKKGTFLPNQTKCED